MDWYGVMQFAKRVEEIENYFVALAANEEDIQMFGFRVVLELPGAGKALEALSTFGEDFAFFGQESERLGSVFKYELEQLKSEGKIIEQVALVSLRLRMAQAKVSTRVNLSTVLSRAFGVSPKGKSIFSENQVPLDRTIIDLGKLRALAKRGARLLQDKESSDDEVFKPSNVKSDRVVELIDAALAQIQSTTSMAPEEVARLQQYLSEARAEAQSNNPSWSKIVGALVIVAAVTSGLADAPGAAKTVRDAIEYILGTSVQKPLQRYLPSQVEDFNKQSVPSDMA